MYCTGRNIVTKAKHPELYALLERNASLAKLLSNAALFRLRQNFTLRSKASPTPNELEVLSEIETVVRVTGKTAPKAVISYNFLEKMMRVTGNPDFFAGLPMQTAQHILRQRVQSFKDWLAALRVWKNDPSSFTGKPAMPKYIKSDMCTHVYTNQECVIYRSGSRCFLKFPRTKQRLEIQPLPQDAILKEVTAKPHYGSFEILYTYECASPVSSHDLCYDAAADLGVDNIAAIVTSSGHSLLVKGGAVKAANQWYNKKKACLTSLLTAGHKTTRALESRALSALSAYRNHFMLDACHQISCRIVDFCLEHRVATLYVGRNRFWKQNSDIGKSSNQNFVSIPFAMLRGMITYKAERAGIRVILCEESYTSKASFIDGDYIPTYNVDDDKAAFSGRRISRGLYRTADGTIINADLNGAANILRKAKQDALEKDMDISFLKNPEVLYYTGLHEKRTPEKRDSGCVNSLWLVRTAFAVRKTQVSRRPQDTTSIG